MKKIMIALLCALVVTAMAGCAANKPQPEAIPQEPTTQIANPIVTYETLAKAREAVNFEFKVPTFMPNGEGLYRVHVIDKTLIQLVYFSGDKEIVYRVAEGSEDISGNYNDHTYKETYTTPKGKDIELRGSEDGVVNYAVWLEDGYSYSVYFMDKGTPEDAGAIADSLE